MIEEFKDERLILRELQKEETAIQKDEKKINIAFFGIGILFIIIFIGVFYLFLRPNSNQRIANVASESTPTPSTPSISAIAKVTNSPTPTPIVIIKEVVKENSVKEQFIPFGSGTNQTTDWADVPGLQANIDFGNYQNIKDVRFEVSVNIPTGTASVRLFNTTDKHPVWNSEVTTTSDIYTVSPSLIYDKGVKTYQVQMKTQLKSLANLTLARIHITTN